MKRSLHYPLRQSAGAALVTAMFFCTMAAAEDTHTATTEKPSSVYTGKARPPAAFGNRNDIFLESGSAGTITVLQKTSDTDWQVIGALARPPAGTATQPQQCQTGAFMIGIDSHGGIICEDLKTTVAGEKRKCHGHGVLKDGFCSCDSAWTGAECERRKPPKDPNAPPDEDHDNFTSPPDCNDHDDMVYPGAPDAVDGKDNDCDGEVDEGY